MDKSLRTVFVNNFREILSRKKISQKDVADSLNIPFTTISTWANGKSYPRIDRMELLAEFLGVSRIELMYDKNEQSKYYLQTLFYRAGLNVNDYYNHADIEKEVIEILPIITKKYKK